MRNRRKDINDKKSAAAAAAATGTMSSILDDIKADIKAIIAEKNCGPIFIRLSWHDAGVYSTGKLTGGELLDGTTYSAEPKQLAR
jgi:catalase (peroxidase I)